MKMATTGFMVAAMMITNTGVMVAAMKMIT
jgi:hypothetical protein